jgi:Glycosyltransferase family 10 (fucosyltransferase) C-term/Concanavalin A-like lectin/glucanases superfamily
MPGRGVPLLAPLLHLFLLSPAALHVRAQEKDKHLASPPSSSLPATPSPLPPVRILIWAGGSWQGFLSGPAELRTPNYLGHAIDKRAWECQSQCVFTGDRSPQSVRAADAVVFEAQPLTSYYDDYLLNKVRLPPKLRGQTWVMTGAEQEHYFDVLKDPDFMRYMDLNVSFSTAHSAVQATFFCVWGGAGVTEPGRYVETFREPPPPIESKKKAAVFFATNCDSAGASYRKEYVRELMRHYHVDSFGRCLKNAELPKEMQFPIYSDHGASMKNKISVFSKYRYVLAFENNNITDYVTEKVVNAMQAGSLPIYMGAPNFKEDWMPADHSVVLTSDFQSPAALARYLHYLDRNDTAYMQYFAWKQKPYRKQFVERFDNCVFYGAECRLCEFLTRQRERQGRALAQVKIDERRSIDNFRYLDFPPSSSALLSAPRLSGTALSDGGASLWFAIAEHNKNSPLASGNAMSLVAVGSWRLEIVNATFGRMYLRMCTCESPGRDSSDDDESCDCHTGSRALRAGQWYHVSAVWSLLGLGESFFVVNGWVDPLEHRPRRPFSVEGGNVTIGRGFFGSLDDVRVYNATVSRGECVENVYTSANGSAGDALRSRTLVGWHFDSQEAWKVSSVGEKTELQLCNSGDGGKVSQHQSMFKPMVTANHCS